MGDHREYFKRTVATSAPATRAVSAASEEPSEEKDQQERLNPLFDVTQNPDLESIQQHIIKLKNGRCIVRSPGEVGNQLIR